jgi:hypothetical protein
MLRNKNVIVVKEDSVLCNPENTRNNHLLKAGTCQSVCDEFPVTFLCVFLHGSVFKFVWSKQY